MTTTHHPKIIVAVIVCGALALAAPAGASVLNPITDSWNAGGSGVQTVNSTYQPSSDQNGSGNTLASAPADPSSVAGFQRSSVSASSGDGAVTTAAVPMHGLSYAPVATTQPSQPSSGGDGFDVGSAAVGGGAVLLLACLAMIGSSAIGGRRDSHPKPGTAIQAA